MASSPRIVVPPDQTAHTLDWLTGSAAGQLVLERRHRVQQAHRLRCGCQPGGRQPALVIRLLQDHYYIARMPETGHLHARGCPMFSEDSALSGVAEYAGALRYRGEVAEVKVGFALHAAVAPAAGRGGRVRAGDTVRRGSMGLAGLLSLLWTHSELHTWTPGTVRPWVRVRSSLLEAAARIYLDKRCLADRLCVQGGAGQPWLPPAPGADADWGAYRLLLFKVGSMARTPLGGAYLKTSGGEAVLAPKAVLSAWMTSYPRVAPFLEARGSGRASVVCLALAHWKLVRGAPCLTVLQGALMLTNWRAIPVESTYELQIADLLVEQERRFMKPMRYDAAVDAVFPDFVLSDAGEGGVPLEVYGISGNAQYEARKRQKRAWYQAQGQCFWEWTPPAPVPPLPGKVL
ncbi:DUF1173 family protein [Massilia soli]|uniref:DUF1173 domain-containing protein n=1 Tax=Massilia soli TaxID=2792854 RepID=A0ABS7SMR4_9BURK|nr:DUF1173 family protein [Massilia soli]MBZ2207166.1 DUF1173 domain-containing protein [Massilia soli]